MKKYLFSGIALLILSLIVAGSSVALASSVPNTPALYESYLANSQGSSDTTFSLASATLRDGTALAGFYCFTIDSNTPTVEYECGTVSGTTVTVSTRGIDAVSGTTTATSLKYAHRRGADVKITDYPTLTVISRIFQAIDTALVPIKYDPSIVTATFTDRAQIVNKGYVDDAAFSGAGVINATTAARGIVQLATGLQIAASTGAGSSGATLVIPASLSTSTWNKGSNTNIIPVTALNGYMDTNFLSPYASTTWAASSTAKATFHGLPYNFPSVRGASSTALSEDGSGNLTFENYEMLLNGASSTPQNISGTTASSTVYSFSLPGGLLGTNNVLRITLYMDETGAGIGDKDFFEMAYGNSTTTAYIQPWTGGTFNAQRVSFTISGKGTTNSQLLFGEVATSSISVPTTGATDSTAANNVLIIMKSSATTANHRIYYATTELLRY